MAPEGSDAIRQRGRRSGSDKERSPWGVLWGQTTGLGTTEVQGISPLKHNLGLSRSKA